ncbi:MAG TPA: M23 family metallopeptidase [Candidatus Binatia bacterium]|nr:M23 family metallopeptidase [Candidatus Binatia bacterium]
MARASVTPRLMRERLLPVAVACLVVVAAALSVGAGSSAASGVGNVNDGPRLAIGGDGESTWYGTDGSGVTGIEGDTTNSVVDGAEPSSAALGDSDPALDPEAGPFLDDGTLVMPVAVDTTVDDGSAKLVTYKVKSGDTLTGIAHRFGVSMMTLWWANKLTDKDELHVGQILVIPPVTGLVITVAAGDTLASIAARTGVSAQDILDASGITDPNLVIGQRLIIPGGAGKGIPTPKPTPKPVAKSGGGGTYHPPQTTYHGGKLAWPVPGGYISQYFWSGHPALDIAAPYGSRIVAAAAGTVIFAGWKDNEGGYQVWVSHGSGLYTGYYHMSAITVGIGEHVGRGQQIGRVGTSGVATGPHCHFEVWRGYPWESGSYRVNPLGYL